MGFQSLSFNLIHNGRCFAGLSEKLRGPVETFNHVEFVGRHTAWQIAIEREWQTDPKDLFLQGVAQEQVVVLGGD